MLNRHHRIPDTHRVGERLVRARHLEVEIAGKRIIHDINIDLYAGEVVALVGPNGAGKSTLLAAISADLPLSRGEVLINEREISRWNTTELAMRRAVLLQNIGISFPFTVEEVVRMGRSPWAGTPAETQDELIVSAAMRMTQVEELRERSYTTLSGGEKGRVAFARVLSQATPLIFLDEATAAMDIRHQEMVMGIARDYARQGGGVLLVVHSLDVAAAYADRIILMKDGTIVEEGKPRDVLKSEILSTVYSHPIRVIEDPDTANLLIIPQRPFSPLSPSDHLPSHH
ncbi:heme ABC transporter ATP-binding protein [Schaalia sp. lx-260]|uniref:heme ABC transporter ATP-binding protein n=1 Tax=Schaalia sp. lx-260 TaxID=2899082 RepID=UPI001E43C2E9|nr:heme ABC transporter ATP-binding protein [Schaalia sp. lx-260]MCD4549021.1 heme ABC transporter ATP-binding protein [Schaalia sp. lx-260]